MCLPRQKLYSLDSGVRTEMVACLVYKYIYICLNTYICIYIPTEGILRSTWRIFRSAEHSFINDVDTAHMIHCSSVCSS